MKKIAFALVAICIAGYGKLYAQSTAAKVNTVQPSIMVIPFTKENEDIRTVLESDFNRRVAISKVKEGFDNRGFTTFDFSAKLKAALDDKLFTSENQSDIKSALVEMSGADIFVEVEVPEMIQTAGGNSARIILQAFDASTGASLSNKTCESPKFNTTDYGALITRAISKSSSTSQPDKALSPCLEDFLNVMQIKFTDIVENGRGVKVNFSIAQGSKYKFSTEIKPDAIPFSDLLETWMGDNAVKNNYHIQGTTDVKIFFDEVRIPLKDDNGKNYSPSKFALKIYQFLKTKTINCSKQIKNGTIYITITS